MGMPSPFDLGRSAANSIGGGFDQIASQSNMDKILAASLQSDDPDVMDRAIAGIMQNVSPQNQPVALHLLNAKKAQMAKRKQASAYEKAGFDPSVADLPEEIQKQLVQSKGKSEAKPNPAAQKWAYDELNKSAPLKALKTAISEMRTLNDKGFTGPVSGHVPSSLASKEADATRKALDANAIQILNVHKSMFPRGLTQGEFKTLSQKLASSTNTKEANTAILDAYDRLVGLQEKKLQAVQQAVAQNGFDPMLPFIVSGIQKQFDEEEEQENRQLFDTVMNPKKSTEKVEVKETLKTPTEKISLEEIFPTQKVPGK